MQEDFHYYATYCAACIAGFSPEEASAICFSANFVDLCSATFLSGIKAPLSAATTQLNMEMADTKMNLTGRQGITRVWSSFHFLPRDLYADPQKGSKAYREKYRLICGPNGDLVKDTVELAKGKSLQHIGISMHVLADTWAHRYFAGTPSLVINNISGDVVEEVEEEGAFRDRKISFRHSLSGSDDLEKGIYTSSIFQISENAVMNLGHGRAGHLPDYSFIRYRYMPAWGGYEEIRKDNPDDYLHAFTQMIHALKFLRGDLESFEKETYDFPSIAKWEDEILKILKKRQLIACEDWKRLGEKITGSAVAPFDRDRYREEFLQASEKEKEQTFLGKFIRGAVEQKNMVTEKIFESGSRLAGKIEK